jgi:hypothetical protein
MLLFLQRHVDLQDQDLRADQRQPVSQCTPVVANSRPG